MAQVSTGNLTTELDRMARHASEAAGVALAHTIATGGAYLATTPNAGLAVANTDVLSNMQTAALAYADADQLEDFVPSIADLNRYTPSLNPFLYSFWAARLAAFEKHLGRYNSKITGDLSFLDAALRGINASAITLRAHGNFGAYFGGLSPANMFCPTPFILATIAVTSGTTATFAHVSAISNFYGVGQIALLNTKANNTEAVITVTCIKSGVATSVAITAGAATSQWLTAATDTSQTYSDCTALVSITTGTSGDAYALVILPDRTIYVA